MIRTPSQDELAAKVKNANKVNAVANDLATKLAAIFAPLVGQKVIKADGGLTKKIKVLVEDLETPHRGGLVQVWHTTSNPYSLAWTVKGSENYNGICDYYSVTVYVGNVKGDTLESLTDVHTRRTDLSVDEINRLVEDHKEKEKAATDAASKLYQTGLF